MDQAGILQFVVDHPSALQEDGVSAPTPQQFYSPPSPATVYVARPRAAPVVRNSNISVLTALLVILLVVAILYTVFMQRTRGSRSLAQDLAACGWILYTQPRCSLCAKQMIALGVKTYPKQVVCVEAASSASGTMSDSQGPYTCKTVQAFPFWANEFTNTTRTGFQSRQQLRQMLRNPSAY